MMKYRLEVYTIKELGAREKQEDSIYPEYGKAKSTDRLFILCDGMGGHSDGEIASGTVCQAMGKSILERCPDEESILTEDDFKLALQDALDVSTAPVLRAARFASIFRILLPRSPRGILRQRIR